MSDTLYASRPITGAAWLERAEKTWRIPYHHAGRTILPHDDLFLGDKLWFRSDTNATYLILKIVFPAARMFDGERAERVYRVVAGVSCPDCKHGAVHPITIADTGTHRPGGLAWTFIRHCDCGATWHQDGQQPYLRTDD